MTSVNDIRSSFLGYFEKNGHERVRLEPARAAQRSDADVRQFGHGAVQERLHRRREARLHAAPPPRRRACAPAASTTTSTMSASPRATSPSSRCSATSRSATTSRSRRSTYAWELLTKEIAHSQGQALGHHLRGRRRGARPLEEDRGPLRRQDRPARRQVELLADGRHRPLRPELGNLLRPRRQVLGRPSGLARGRRRPLHRDLEPRLHAVRAAAGRRRASSCRSPRSIPAWASSASRRCLQGTNNVFETDLFRALVDAAAQATGTALQGLEDGKLASLRVIADHLRSMSFLIAEGVLPSNEGRGYVLRRIMRRAMRHATLLGANEPVIHKLVPTLVREMGQAYPELVRGEHDDRRDRPPRGAAGSSRRCRAACSCSTRRAPASRQGRHARGRHRLQALRHLSASRST